MNRRGFTFTELVCACAIIAVLGAILFPVFARAREKARQASCLANLQNIGVALRMYAYENYGHLPPTDNDLRPLLPCYLADAEVLRCPSASGKQPRGTRPPLGETSAPCDYVYRGGLQDDDRPDQLVAGDKDRGLHNGGANHLFLSGAAKWFSGSGTPFGLEVPGYDELEQLRQAGAAPADEPAGLTPPGHEPEP